MRQAYAAYRDRTVLTLRLMLESPLHVGSGLSSVLSGIEGEVNSVVLDAARKPYIPPTTLKGAIRALARADARYNRGVREDLVNDVFGPEDLERDPAKPGWIVFSGASLVDAPKTAERIDNLEGRLGLGTIMAKRTAIDDASGSADNDKLFQFEMVPPGSVFEARITVFRAPPEGADNIFADAGVILLLRALAALKTSGIAVGRGKGDGAGLLKLAKMTRVERVRVVNGAVKTDVSNDPADWDQQIAKHADAPLSRASMTYVLLLESDQPFAVIGPRLPEKARDGAKGNANVLKAVRRDNRTPELPGSSLMGVLRSRAEWFARLQALREKSPDAETHVFNCIQPLFGEDADHIRSDRLKGRKRTGFAGILRLHSVTLVNKTAQQKLESVKVDRFSMGPFDTGLFAVEAFPKPRFRIELYLDERAQPEDHAFMAAFMDWLQSDAPSAGLMLGHGVNRGFGWFSVKQERAAS